MTIQEHYSNRKSRKRTRPLQVRFVDTVKIHALPLGVVPKEELFYSPQNIQAFQLERFEEEAKALEAERQKAKQARKSQKQEAKRQRRERLQARRKKRAQRSHNNAKNASSGSDEDLYESDVNNTQSQSEAATSATCSSSGSSSETEGEAGAVVVQPQHAPLLLQPTWHHHHKLNHTSPGGRKSPSKRNSPSRKALRMRRQSQTTQTLLANSCSRHLDIPMLHHDDHPAQDDALCELDQTALKYAPADEEEGVALLDSSTATTMAGSPSKPANTTRLGSSRILSWNQEGWKWSTVALFLLLMGSWVWFSFHMGRW